MGYTLEFTNFSANSGGVTLFALDKLFDEYQSQISFDTNLIVQRLSAFLRVIPEGSKENK